MKNFETETFRDVEGDEIPKEKMLIFELEDQTRIAVRGSGTEPKIKYYLFAQRRPENENSILQNLLESRRKWEKSSIGSGIACKRMPRRACAKTIGNDFRSLRQGRENNLKLQIPSSRYSKRRVILSESKDLWHLSPALVTIIRDVSLRST